MFGDIIVRRTLKRIKDWFEDTHYGIKNVIRWTPVIWKDADFDWEYLANVMEYKLRRMHKSFTEYGHHVNSDQDARECLVCAELIKRLRDGVCHYLRNSESFIGASRHATKVAIAVEKHDLELLGKIIGKKLNCWWD